MKVVKVRDNRLCSRYSVNHSFGRERISIRPVTKLRFFLHRAFRGRALYALGCCKWVATTCLPRRAPLASCHMHEAAPPPKPGAVVRARQRQYLVEDVVPPAAPGDATLVRL